MSEFKYACPVCGQHMMCDSSQAGTTMECPTCFQKIMAPQAPSMADPKFIITGTKVGAERPIPSVVANAQPLPAPVPEKSFPGPAVVFIALFCIAAAVLLAFHGKIFRSTGVLVHPGPVTSNGTQTPAPATPGSITGLAMVVFGKTNSIVIGTGTTDAGAEGPVQASFLAAFKTDLANPLAFQGLVGLTAPSGNARIIQGATGEIQYVSSFPGGLVISVKLEGLAPNHVYLLTLNGDVQHAGNNNLPERLNQTSKQRYYDFSTITTDVNGRYQATYGILLPAGPYDVYFFVKDTADWKIVLSHSFFQFIVE